MLDAVAALGGTTVGTVFEGQDRGTPSRSASPRRGGTTPRRSSSIRIVDPQGRPIALAGPGRRDVRGRARARSSARTSSAGRWSGVNVRGRDIAGFVAEAQAAIEAKVKLPPGYLLRWGGQFEHLQTASQRLLIVVPIALALIFLLLYSTFHSLRLAALIYLAVPMAATGGVFALACAGCRSRSRRGSASSRLFGVAVLNGLVWVSAVEHLRPDGVEPHEAAREAAIVRLRPILMTALVAGFGFIPMAIATTPGAEIQRPLATVVIGGLITSTLLTTLVLPAIYPGSRQNPEVQRREGTTRPETFVWAATSLVGQKHRLTGMPVRGGSVADRTEQSCFLPWPADQLKADRQPGRAEAGDRDRRLARQVEWKRQVEKRSQEGDLLTSQHRRCRTNKGGRNRARWGDQHVERPPERPVRRNRIAAQPAGRRGTALRSKRPP